MRRTLVVWAILVILVSTVGCRMCQHPFDYCQPTYVGDGEPCVCDGRAGSVLTRYPISPLPNPAELESSDAQSLTPAPELEKPSPEGPNASLPHSGGWTQKEITGPEFVQVVDQK